MCTYLCAGRNEASWDPALILKSAGPRGSEHSYLGEGWKQPWQFASLCDRKFWHLLLPPLLLMVVQGSLFMQKPLGCAPMERKTWVKPWICLLIALRLWTRCLSLYFGFLICKSERVLLRGICRTIFIKCLVPCATLNGSHIVGDLQRGSCNAHYPWQWCHTVRCATM